MASRSRKVLITGINGFIGSHAAVVLAQDFTVAGIGRQESTCLPVEYHCLQPFGAEFHAFLRDFQPDFVLHTAGSASVFRSITDPSHDFAAGPELVMQLYDSLRSCGLRPFVAQLSSAAVYGDPRSLPVREDAPLHPLSPYGWHKHMSELVGREYAYLNQIPGAALRVFSCYGEGQRKLLLWDACTKLSSGKAEFFGTGDETRDYIHVVDLARFIHTLFSSVVTDSPDPDGPAYRPAYRMINVGTGTSVRVRDVITALARHLEDLGGGAAAEALPIRFNGEIRTGDPRFWQADITAMHEFGFSFCVPFEAGLRDYAQWFMKEQAKSQGQKQAQKQTQMQAKGQNKSQSKGQNMELCKG